MGYLGAYERPTDPATGLIQMGARSYSPGLGRFMTEDPVAGHMGNGLSADRYPYALDNPLNLYDLNGRDTCGTLGHAPVVGGFLESACHAGTCHPLCESAPPENAKSLVEEAPGFWNKTVKPAGSAVWHQIERTFLCIGELGFHVKTEGGPCPPEEKKELPEGPEENPLPPSGPPPVPVPSPAPAP